MLHKLICVLLSFIYVTLQRAFKIFIFLQLYLPRCVMFKQQIFGGKLMKKLYLLMFLFLYVEIVLKWNLIG